MKTLFRIILALFLLLTVALGVGYFIVTRPAFQKGLIVDRLPAGSSIEYIHIKPGSVELTDLELRLPDGTTAKLASLRSDFSPMAALFDKTLQLRGLTVDGLVVELPETTAVTTPGADAPTTGGATPPEQADTGTPSTSAEDPGSPWDGLDALYALGEIDWLFDLDSIEVNGALIDGSRNRYTFELSSSAVLPGEATTVTTDLKLESKETLQGGLKDFNSNARLVFSQKIGGGFERFDLESLTEGSDASGGDLLSVSLNLELVIDSLENAAAVDLSFNVDLPDPGIFVPELATLQGLALQGALKGAAAGDALTLQTANFDAASNGAAVAAVKLNQSLTLGAEQQFAGDLMEINLIKLPLSWINPWLGEGLALTGAPFSAQIAVAGEPGGALAVRSLTPIEMGPFSLAQSGQALLDEVTLRMNPVIRVEADQTIRFDLGDVAMLDRYGEFISGTMSGSKKEVVGDSPLAGLLASAKLRIGLAEVLQQPILANSASVMAGQAEVQLDIDGTAEYPVEARAAITGLRARDMPGSRQDLRMAAQLKETADGGYTLGANFAAGSENRPSTSVQIAGQVQPDRMPIPFKVNLTADRITQSDVDLLMAAAAPRETETTAERPATPPRPAGTKDGSARSPQGTNPAVERPAWADLDGEVSIQAEEFILNSGQVISKLRANARISEALLAVRDIAASLPSGRLGGSADVAYDASVAQAYTVSSALNFKDLDPSIFSQKASGSFPVKGRFDGNFNLTGSGATLEAALNDAEGDLLITGRDGILTAFEMDNRSQLGLIGAGILGQSLDRPGITAMAQAVPYFKDMRFDNFTLKLTRGQDKRVRIPELSFIGDNLRINGQGFIAASSLGEVLDQPLDLKLGFGAKGRLVDYLETLGLLKPATSEDGFRGWKQDINIGGTLSDPDTSALRELLGNAARSALNKSRSTTTPPASSAPEGEAAPEATGEPKEKSKEERRRDDVEMGLDLLNSILG